MSVHSISKQLKLDDEKSDYHSSIYQNIKTGLANQFQVSFPVSSEMHLVAKRVSSVSCTFNALAYVSERLKSSKTLIYTYPNFSQILKTGFYKCLKYQQELPKDSILKDLHFCSPIEAIYIFDDLKLEKFPVSKNVIETEKIHDPKDQYFIFLSFKNLFDKVEYYMKHNKKAEVAGILSISSGSYGFFIKKKDPSSLEFYFYDSHGQDTSSPAYEMVFTTKDNFLLFLTSISYPKLPKEIGCYIVSQETTPESATSSSKSCVTISHSSELSEADKLIQIHISKDQDALKAIEAFKSLKNYDKDLDYKKAQEIYKEFIKKLEELQQHRKINPAFDKEITQSSKEDVLKLFEFFYYQARQEVLK